MLDRSTQQFSRHSLSARKDDCYETPACAVEALLKHEPIEINVWEPCCGPGAIVKVLRAHGHSVFASDLVDYGCPDSESRLDFLMTRCHPDFGSTIVTNPPFKLAANFVRHAIAINVEKIVMLLRLSFLESSSRSDILDGGKLARVLVFKNRLPMMHRKEWQGPRTTSAIAYAWFVWLSRQMHHRPATIERISWE